MKRLLSLVAVIFATALVAFAAGYLFGQRPVAGQVSISLMSVPDPIVPSPARSALIDVNRATAAELTDIPGVGPVTAERIFSYREENGPFSAPEDLLNVRGIGEKTLEKMLEYITFG